MFHYVIAQLALRDLSKLLTALPLPEVFHCDVGVQPLQSSCDNVLRCLTAQNAILPMNQSVALCT